MQFDDTPLPWVQVAPHSPYFVTEEGAPWTPVGHNDSVYWPALEGAIRHKDLASVDAYLQMLAAHGVTVLRLMLEYCQRPSTYFEKPAGRFRPHMVQLWDDLLGLCAKHGVRVLLTPVDTFFMWTRWSQHPYNARNGGPCADIRGMLLCGDTRVAIKNRLTFMTERWGHHGVIFGWDLWNEIHPSYAGDSAACFADFISDLSEHLRGTEMRRFGRAHPQTVSMFGPDVNRHPEIPDSIYRHAKLDFASTHLYEHGSIDFPKNTVDAAISFGRLVRECVLETPEGRPYFDSEHGPIHSFKDKHRTLPEEFDDEYFRHMQWAHLASGGAGGGMRWPNRRWHLLTPGMHRAQSALSGFLPLIDWARFARQNVTEELHVSDARVAGFACADGTQAVVYLLRRDTVGRDGMLRKEAEPITVAVHLPALWPGRYCVTVWDTVRGVKVGEYQQAHGDTPFRVAVGTDVAVAIRCLS